MKFSVKDVVRSKVDAQGMVKGELYRVHEVTTVRNFLGGYTRYQLRTLDEKTVLENVGNGHLILELVGTEAQS